MAIQFHCPGCSQPIEVDDVHAGQAAACPYCRRVVSVPTESSLGELPPIVARPTGGGDDATPPAAADRREPATPPPPQPAPGELHIGPTMTPREQAARTLGSYALICAVLAVLLSGGVFVYAVSQAGPELLKASGSGPSEEQLSAIERRLGENRWLGAAQMGSMFFALIGVVLGITSLVQSRRSNWRAIVSVVVCGLLLSCVCLGTVLAAAGGFGAGS
jgi:hypothetical protein